MWAGVGMSRKIPKFLVYGEGNPEIEERIQPRLPIRNWDALDREEKKLMPSLLSQFFSISDNNTIQTIAYLNHHFMRTSPGRELLKHLTPYDGELSDFDEWSHPYHLSAAEDDFRNIFMDGSEALVFCMLSKFAKNLINEQYYDVAVKENDEEKQQKYIDRAFKEFDKFAKILNHIFGQFSINQMLTRNGFVPRQDERITEDVYVPTLRILANPQWKDVSDDLARMFEDYREKKYAEAITKAHSTVQRFLQILVGENGKNGKGEMGKLFQQAKDRGLISENAEPFVTAIQKTIVRARATSSDAKPAKKDATAADVLLVMNTVMVFLQYCLSK